MSWSGALLSDAAGIDDRPLDDARIIEEFLRSEDDGLFCVLVQRYKDQVFRLVASILGPTAEIEAEDLVQEIFITVYRKLGTFRGDCRFSTWLYRLSRNRAIDWRRRRKSVAIGLGDWGRAKTELPSNEDPHREIERNRRNSIVLRHVDALAEPRRTVVFLHYWMGCGVEEISGLTEIPAGTVKSHLCRARRVLAKRLRRESIDG
jgi:RNA polymerase sigma-70 factor (ECF subfamily)